MQWQGIGTARLLSHGPQHRLLEVNAIKPGRLRLMQWAHPRWQVRALNVEDNTKPFEADRPTPVAADARDPQGWISVPLRTGRWRILITYGEPTASLWQSVKTMH